MQLSEIFEELVGIGAQHLQAFVERLPIAFPKFHLVGVAWQAEGAESAGARVS